MTWFPSAMTRAVFPGPWLALTLVGLAPTASTPTFASSENAGEAASLIASPEPGWPQFRGPRRDGISDERGLLPSWPEPGPPLLWSAQGLGRGHSSPVFGDGRIYITGDFGEDLQVLAYDLEGKPLWRVKNGDAWLNQHQGARSTVTFNAGRLYHQNAHGRLACLEAATGKELWSVNVLERFRGENIRWGISECLLVDERAVYVTAGGRDALLVAFDKVTGTVLWKSEPLLDVEGDGSADNPGYGSPILVRFAGRRLIIGSSQRHLYCADADTGELQWTRRRSTPYSVLAMMPVLAGDTIFMTAPLAQPGALHRLTASAQPGGKVGVDDLWTTKLDTAQGGVVYGNGRFFGSHYPRRGGWTAIEAATGKVLYEEPGMVKGSVLLADNRLYALTEDGWMHLLRDADTQFAVEGRFRLATPRDRDAWTHPVILNGRLYLRFHDTLYCYDIRAQLAPK